MAAPPEGTLSPTLQRVQGEHAEPCDVASLALSILALHGDYADGRAQAIAATMLRPARSRTAPVAQWYDEARSMLDPDLERLSGRTAIVGLALADLAAGREMVRCGLWTCIVADLEEGFDILGERGRRRLAQIPRAGLPVEPRPIELPATQPPQLRGGISPDGSRVIAYGDRPDAPIELWNVESGRPIGMLGPVDPPRPARMVRFSADGASIVGLLRDGSIVRWPVTAFAEPPSTVDVPEPPAGDIASGALSTDATCAVNRLASPGFTVIDTTTGAQHHVVNGDGPITRICVSADGELVAVAVGSQVEAYRHDAGSLTSVERYDLGEPVRALECGGDVIVAVAGDRIDVRVTGPRADAVREAAGSIVVSHPTRVAVSRDGSLCAIVGDDGVTLAEPVNGTVFGILTTPVAAVRAGFSLDGERLLVTHVDGSKRVWDVGMRPSGVRLPPARFHSDRADGRVDFLGRTHDVKAIASLIAATSVEPPMSIGIFGNWGSGKSWFMEQLHREVASISADALASRVPQADVSFYKRIAQVRFNAWHYAEADVLSSLVDHVFTRLDLGDRGDPFTDAKRAAQLDLAVASKAEQDAQAELQAAERDLAGISARRAAAEATRERKAEQLRRQIARDDAVHDTVTAALESVGWTPVGAAAGNLVDALRENRHELERAGLVLGPLVRGSQPDVRRRRRLAFLNASLGPVLALVIGAAVAIWSDAARAALAGAGGLLIGGLAGAADLVHRHTTFIRSRLDALAAAEREIDERVTAGLADVDQQIEQARQDEIEVREAVAAKRQELTATQQTVEQRAAQLAEVTPERLLEDLIDARIASGEYAKQLGVIALARSDFEKVSSLIEAANERLLRKGAAERLDDDTGVNRIVLYIDDLDRCDTAKVAQVLQAVHLLLAFPLFVVVVAVDPRWVGRALRKEYPELLAGGDVDANEYLEKVFQIPFWLDQLDGARTAAMLEGLAQVTASRSATERRALAGTAARHPGDPVQANTSFDDNAIGPGSAPADPPAVDPAQAARSRELNPPALALDAHELDAMQALAPVLATASPRSLKRFVNIYRLCKVRADDPADFADPDRPDADYRAVLYLLAQVTRDPASAAELVAAIRAAAPGDTVPLPDLPEGWSGAIAPFQRWAHEVSRFSFHAVMTPPPPHETDSETVTDTDTDAGLAQANA